MGTYFWRLNMKRKILVLLHIQTCSFYSNFLLLIMIHRRVSYWAHIIINASVLWIISLVKFLSWDECCQMWLLLVSCYPTLAFWVIPIKLGNYVFKNFGFLNSRTSISNFDYYSSLIKKLSHKMYFMWTLLLKLVLTWYHFLKDILF